MNEHTPRVPGPPAAGRAWSRRQLLRAGGLSVFGLGLADWLAVRRAHADETRPARSCILIWLDGGPSHLETFDVKEDAPQEVRGPFAGISTALPGVRISELMPRTAGLLDRMAIIRSVTSPLGEHNFGTHYMMTGYRPTPVIEYAVTGSVMAHVAAGDSLLPPFVAVPDFRVGGGRLSGNGYLPASTRPFSVGGDPAKQDFQVRDLEAFPGVSVSRIERRRSFLDALNGFDRAVQAQPPAVDRDFETAYRMMTSADARQAFELDREPQEVRQRYGPRTVGQCCLMARRLVERGVPFVTVNYRGWDTHTELVTRLRDGYTGARVPVGLVPSLDLALTALIEDLEQRGLLDSTLVVVMGEFGRTPKLNTNAGRDHWPRVFSVALAGGGVPGGQVIGASDRVGESPQERPVTPSDLVASIYQLLGIDPETTLHTPDGRPVRLVPETSQVVRELTG